MNRTHLLLGAIALMLGIAAAIVGDRPPQIDASAIVREIEAERDHVAAEELAGWIRTRKSGLRIIDLRPADEFSSYRIPGATNLTLDSLLKTRLAAGDQVVLYTNGGAHAAQAWVLLRARGHRNVLFLSGGLDEWLKQVVEPALSGDRAADAARRELSRYFGGRPRSLEGTAPTDPVRSSDERQPYDRRRGC